MASLDNLINNTPNMVNRAQLEPKFNTGEIPEQVDFYGLIHNGLSRREDGIFKTIDNPLCIQAATGDANKNVLHIYALSNTDPEWALRLNTANNLIVDGNGKRLFISAPTEIGGSFDVIGNASVEGDLGVDASVTADRLTTGSGNSALQIGGGSIIFPNVGQQKIRLSQTSQGNDYAIGTQTNTFYLRSDANFAWYRRGSYTSAALNPGSGGTTLMSLTSTGDLEVTRNVGCSILNASSSITAGNNLQVENNISLSGTLSCNRSNTTNSITSSIYVQHYNEGVTPGGGWGGVKGVLSRVTSNTQMFSTAIFGDARGGSDFAVGVRGHAEGSGDAKYGVYAQAIGSGGLTSYGIYAVASGSDTNYAGYFAGNVRVTGSLTKGSGSFLIDHPQDPKNKTLRHNFVESPEYLCLYRGKAKIGASGKKQVKLPNYFTTLTKANEATIHLSSIGKKPHPLSYEWKDSFDAFFVYGEPNTEISYIVLADRDDPAIHILSRPVEEDKGNGNGVKGEYLHPEAYESKSRNVADVAEMPPGAEPLAKDKKS